MCISTYTITIICSINIFQILLLYYISTFFDCFTAKTRFRLKLKIKNECLSSSVATQMSPIWVDLQPIRNENARF